MSMWMRYCCKKIHQYNNYFKDQSIPDFFFWFLKTKSLVGMNYCYVVIEYHARTSSQLPCSDQMAVDITSDAIAHPSVDKLRSITPTKCTLLCMVSSAGEAGKRIT